MSDPVLSPRLVRRGMNLSIASAVLLTVFGATAGGAILTGLLRSIDFSNPKIGLVMSVPLLSPPMQLLGAWLQRRYFNRKRFWIFCSTVQFSLYVVLIALVTMWARIPAAAGFLLFLTVYALAQAFTQLPSSVNLSWLGELVPRRESAAFWSRRTGLAGISTMIGGVALGKLIDLLGRSSPHTYVVVFLIGVAFGFASTLVFAAAADPDPEPRPGEPFRETFLETWRNRDYRILTGFFSYQSLLAWFSTGFIFVYLQAQDGMNFSMITIQIMLAISALVAFLSGYFFRVAGAKFGRKPLLILCSLLKAAEFVFWGTLTPENGVLDRLGQWAVDAVAATWGGGPVAVPPGAFGSLPVFLLGGFVNMGIASCQMSLLTSLGNKRIQSMAIAVFASVVGLCGVLTSSISGYLYDWLQAQPWVAASALAPFNFLALLSGFGFLTSVLLLRPFREDGAAPTSDLVRVLLSQNPVRAVYQAHLLSQPMTEFGRVETLRRSGGNLVADEVIRSLYNPSSRVRDGALLSLSRQEGEPDPVLIGEVIKLLEIPELGMQSMAARTLGRLRQRAGVPALLRQLRAPDRALAQSAIFALGQIGDPGAEPELRLLLAGDSRLELRPMAAEALSKVGDWRDARLLFPVFEVENYGLLRLQCLIALVRSMLPDRESVHPAFEQEIRLPGAELERQLRLVALHDGWEAQAPVRPVFARQLEQCDRGEFLLCATELVSAELQLAGLAAASPPAAGDAALSGQFAPGGRVRDARLNSDRFEAVGIWVQLKLWTQLKYNAHEEETRLILLAIAIVARTLLDRGELNRVFHGMEG